MDSPDVAIGSGSLVYALCKLDGRLQEEEAVAHGLLNDKDYGALAICALFLRDNMDDPAEEDRAFGPHLKAEKPVEFTKETKKRFVSILLRVARAHDGISREERAFLRQFWRALQAL